MMVLVFVTIAIFNFSNIMGNWLDSCFVAMPISAIGYFCWNPTFVFNKVWKNMIVF